MLCCVASARLVCARIHAVTRNVQLWLRALGRTVSPVLEGCPSSRHLQSVVVSVTLVVAGSLQCLQGSARLWMVTLLFLLSEAFVSVNSVSLLLAFRSVWALAFDLMSFLQANIVLNLSATFQSTVCNGSFSRYLARICRFLWLFLFYTTVSLGTIAFRDEYYLFGAMKKHLRVDRLHRQSNSPARSFYLDNRQKMQRRAFRWSKHGKVVLCNPLSLAKVLRPFSSPNIRLNMVTFGRMDSYQFQSYDQLPQCVKWLSYVCLNLQDITTMPFVAHSVWYTVELHMLAMKLRK